MTNLPSTKVLHFVLKQKTKTTDWLTSDVVFSEAAAKRGTLHTLMWEQASQSAVESGRITTPTFAICDGRAPSYRPAPVVEGQHACTREHTSRPHDCRSASEKRKADCPPFNLVKGQKKKREKTPGWINGRSIYGLREVLLLLSSNKYLFLSFFFLCTAEYWSNETRLACMIDGHLGVELLLILV